MEAGVRVRKLEPHDLAPVLKLTQLIPEAPSWRAEDFAAALGDAPLLRHPDPASRLIRKAWVAEAQRQVLGLVVLQGLHLVGGEIAPAEETGPECEIENLAVHPSARRRGVGRLLLETAIAWCVEQHATVLRLEVRESNAAAVSLYQKLGFLPTGVRPRYYTSPEEDALLMQRNF